MIRQMTCMLAAILLATMPQPALSQFQKPNTIIDFQLQRPFKEYKGWTVAVNRSQTRCFAMTMFQDQTAVWLGVSPAGNDFLIAFANRAWSSVEAGKTYELEVAYNRRNWRGTFTGFAYGEVIGLVSTGLNEDFVADFGRSPSFEIRYQGKLIGRLSLQGSKAALLAAMACAGELTKPGDPFALQSAQADPFAAQQAGDGDISLADAPGVKLEFGEDMPRIGSEWSLGVDERDVVDATIASTDQTLVLRLSPARKENEFPVKCKYSVALYSPAGKPAPGTMASWSAGRMAATDQNSLVQLQLAGGSINTFTEPDDFYGGRAFDFDFNPSHVAATSIEVSVPSLPNIKPVKFEFQNFETVLSYLCASTQTVGFDGENALSPEAISRGGVRRELCRMETCNWSVVRSKAVLWADYRGALIRVETIEGRSEHPGEEDYPTELTDSVKVAWNSKPYEYHVFCSKGLPTVIWSTDQGKYKAEYVDFTKASGVSEAAALRYSEDCHRTRLHRDLTTSVFAEHFGYRAANPPAETELAHPYDIFKLVK
jgi:hypothetical protein